MYIYVLLLYIRYLLVSLLLWDFADESTLQVPNTT